MLTLVLLPGLGGTGRMFEPLVEALGGEFATQIVPYPNAPLGYAEMEPLVRQALPQTGPFAILGESFAGPLAVSLAAARPAGLVGIVLCASFVRNPLPWLAPLRWAVDWLPVGGMPMPVLSWLVMGRRGTRALESALAGALSQSSASALRARMQAVLSVDVTSSLGRVEVPVLYLRASHDRVVPASAGELVCRLMPSVKLVTIDSPHFLLQVAAPEAAHEIAAFLRASHQGS